MNAWTRRKNARDLRALVGSVGTPAERIAARVPHAGSVDFLERFWSRISEGAGCWEWRGQIDARVGQGYGLFKAVGRPYRAHRIAWELTHGVELQPDEFVCHKCDNPPCCNTSHHFLGSVTDNNRDALSKGRRHSATRAPAGEAL